MKKTIVLLSGGLDSTVTAYLSKNKSDHLFALTFLYGQRHEKEIKAAKNIGKKLEVEDHVFFSLDLSQFGGSSLFESSHKTIPHQTTLSDIGKTIPTTYVPARNTVFLSIALAYAETIDADTIAIGVTSEDFSGYPDCRPAFIQSFQQLINTATKKTIEGQAITIFAPLLHLKKDEIICKGSLLGVPFELTWSCYQGKRKACGRCDSCQLRLHGFKKAGIKDPILYEYFPDWYDS